MSKFHELAEWRKKTGLTQGELGAKVGRIQRSVSRWESGAEPVPKDAMDQFRALGYTGPVSARDTTLTRADVEEIVAKHLAALLQEIRMELRKSRQKESP